MFILNIDDLDIKPCLLVDNTQTNPEIVSGILYLNYSFIPVEFYSKNNLQEAREKCQELLQSGNTKFSIITESTEQFIVWSKNERLMPIKSVKKTKIKQLICT